MGKEENVLETDITICNMYSEFKVYKDSLYIERVETQRVFTVVSKIIDRGDYYVVFLVDKHADQKHLKWEVLNKLTRCLDSKNVVTQEEYETLCHNYQRMMGNALSIDLELYG